MKRRSLELTEAQWQQLEALAVATDSRAEKGPSKDQPSWRTLIRRIAEGELRINKATATRAGQPGGSEE